MIDIINSASAPFSFLAIDRIGQTSLHTSSDYIGTIVQVGKNKVTIKQ